MCTSIYNILRFIKHSKSFRLCNEHGHVTTNESKQKYRWQKKSCKIRRFEKYYATGVIDNFYQSRFLIRFNNQTIAEFQLFVHSVYDTSFDSMISIPSCTFHTLSLVHTITCDRFTRNDITSLTDWLHFFNVFMYEHERTIPFTIVKQQKILIEHRYDARHDLYTYDSQIYTGNTMKSVTRMVNGAHVDNLIQFIHTIKDIVDSY